jgi:hypothetical protein
MRMEISYLFLFTEGEEQGVGTDGLGLGRISPSISKEEGSPWKIAHT